MSRRMRELRPVSREPDASEDVRRAVVKAVKRMYYLPILAALGIRPGFLKNASSDLRHALQSGQVQYVDGHFEGRFSAGITKELRELGAKWDRAKSWYSLPRAKLTADLRSAIAASESKFREMAGRVDRELAKLVDLEPEEFLSGTDALKRAQHERITTDWAKSKLKVEKIIDHAIYKSEDEFKANVRSITVSPTLTPEQNRRVAAEYTNNLHLEVQDWMREEIVRLRQKVQAQAQAGARYESLVDEIQRSYGVTQNKARFIARQETSLLMTKLAQTRYESVGVTEYKWQCVSGSAAHPVRKMHKDLDGTPHKWNDPPIVDKQGNRKNPGQDYNCRCRAIPIVRF